MITITMMITAMTSRTTQPPEASAAMSSSTAAAIAFAAATADFAATLAASVAALAAAFVASAVFLAVSWAVLNGFVRAVIHYGYEDEDAGDVLSKADKNTSICFLRITEMIMRKRKPGANVRICIGVCLW